MSRKSAAQPKIERFYRHCGNRITELRTRAQLSQEELGTLVGLGRTSICNIETGRQRILLHQLAHFAKALRVTPETIMRGLR